MMNIYTVLLCFDLEIEVYRRWESHAYNIMGSCSIEKFKFPYPRNNVRRWRR